MIGLLSYPILIEPHFRLPEQSQLVGVQLCDSRSSHCRLRSHVVARATAAESGQIGPSSRRRALVASRVPRALALAGIGVRSLEIILGVTTVLTTEIPPIPMFWVVPLAIYLLSFILVFGKKPVVSHSQLAERVPLLILAGIIPLLLDKSWPLFLEIVVNLMILFVVAVACHGDIAKRRPTDPSHRLLSVDSLGWSPGRTAQCRNRAGRLRHGFGIPSRARSTFAALLLQIMLRGKTATLQLARCRVPVRDRRTANRSRSRFAIIEIRAGRRPLALSSAFSPSLLLCFSFAKRPIRFALG